MGTVEFDTSLNTNLDFSSINNFTSPDDVKERMFYMGEGGGYEGSGRGDDTQLSCLLLCFFKMVK